MLVFHLYLILNPLSSHLELKRVEFCRFIDGHYQLMHASCRGSLGKPLLRSLNI